MVRRRSPRRSTTRRKSGILLAVLLVATWAASAWWPDERGAAAGSDLRPPRAGVPRPPIAFDLSPPAAAERGEFGFPMLLLQALADGRVSMAAGELAAPGMSASDFRTLYEGDPGDAARFMFARRVPRADWSAH